MLQANVFYATPGHCMRERFSGFYLQLVGFPISIAFFIIVIIKIIGRMFSCILASSALFLAARRLANKLVVGLWLPGTHEQLPISSYGMSALPDVVRDVVLERFLHDQPLIPLAHGPGCAFAF